MLELVRRNRESEAGTVAEESFALKSAGIVEEVNVNLAATELVLVRMRSQW
jgi:hypothetical protein